MIMRSEVTGQGDPLVLVPGGFTGWVSWLPHTERLSATRRVVRVQLLSVQLGLDGQRLPADYSPKMESAALANTLRSLGLTLPLDVAGWSYGTMVALDFALDHPAWVRTLTLIEPSGYWILPALDDATEKARQGELRASREYVSEDDLEAFLIGMALVPPGSKPREMNDWSNWSRYRQSLRVIAFEADHEDDRKRLTSFRPPVLVVKGSDSAPVAHRIADALVEQLPNAQLADWPGGHAPHIVSMEPFLERLKAFHAAAP
jgi:pimeloyl-ACP methyl ester carboxylesterase